MNLGRFYALVIGIQNYREIEPLQTPLSDAHRAARVLQERYGFKVTVVDDADDVELMAALNDLLKILKPDDNLLIYYAGHGYRTKGPAQERGYWLPINSDRPPNTTYWIISEKITDLLGLMPARRILVVADSCYGGFLSEDPAQQVSATRDVSLNYIRVSLDKRARLLISSGGDKPVLDQGGGGNSVFARAFLEILETNDRVLTARSLFAQLQDRVRQAAAQSGFDQVPVYKILRPANHKGGFFVFVPSVH
jgi:hypothetical protein